MGTFRSRGPVKQDLPGTQLHGGIRRVRTAAALLLLSISPLHAALLAHVTTTRGTVTVALQHATAPKAVANFMTLAQGTRSRINPLTGLATTDPLYIGEKFFRTANTTSFKFAQTGSGTGTNVGTSGFTFQDEFTPTVRHTGYTLSSANAGPNTNNGQIFLTGNVTIPSYDDVHSIIGLIPDSASRAVVDSIITSGDNATTITGITFERTDATAIAFNELAQALPEVSPLSGTIKVVKGSSVTWNSTSALGSRHQLRIFRSQNLQTWTETGTSFAGNNLPPLTSAIIDDGSLAKAFYRFSLARYPDDATNPLMEGADFVANLPEAGLILTYDFNAQGTGGTITATSSSASESGTFILRGRTVSPYKVEISVDNGTTVTPRFLRYTAHSDKFAPGQSSGRLSVDYSNGLFWSYLISGTQTLSN